MSQSLVKNLIHLIFSTKNRERTIDDLVTAGLHAYMSGIFRDLDSPATTINSVPDHIHVLFDLSKNHALKNVIMEVKRGSSIWIKTQGVRYDDFHWQSGYGAFSIGQSAVAEVTDYIAKQSEHHLERDFQNEFRAFLHRYEVPYDERYVWD